MTRFDLRLEDFTFPVRGKVRYNGEVLMKYDLAYYIDILYPYIHATIIYDAFTYGELVKVLKEHLENK